MASKTAKRTHIKGEVPTSTLINVFPITGKESHASAYRSFERAAMGCFSLSRRPPARLRVRKRFAGGAGRRNIPRAGFPPFPEKQTPNLLTEHQDWRQTARRESSPHDPLVVRNIAAMRKEQTMSEQPHDTEPVTIVLATRNQGKVRELAEPLRAFGLRVVGLDAFPDLPEVEETGTTFEENALLKAREVSERTGLVAIADDSGLEVDALNGAPGVYLRPLQRGHAGSARRHQGRTQYDEAPRGPVVRAAVEPFGALPQRRRRLYARRRNPHRSRHLGRQRRLLPARQKRLRLRSRFPRSRAGPHRRRNVPGRKNEPQPQGQGPARAAAPLALLLGKGISGRELDFSASDCDFGADKNPT